MQATVSGTAPDASPTRRFIGQHYKLPPVTLASLLVEWFLIFIFAFSFTAFYRDPSASRKLYGGEAEWLTSHPYLAAQSLKEMGRIVYWQPYLAFGEPLIDNPFSSVLNPATMLPVLGLGAEQGIRFSIFIYALIAGYGGWTLARVLGLGFLGRAVLALLMIGKGNMLANIGTGYYQLGVTQAYMPWIIAGALGTLRLQKRRWPVILTVVGFTLMFWGGNLWHMLPMLIMVVLLAVTHIFDIRRENDGFRVKVDLPGIRRLTIAAIFTIGLTMVTLLPIWSYQNRITNHPNETDAGTVVDLGKVLRQFVDGNVDLYFNGEAPSNDPQFHYSYISPLWFAVLMFVVLPPIPRVLYRSPQGRYWRIIAVLIFMAIFATIWGSGGNPMMIWLYKNLPLLPQWRFVGRALGTASFAIAMLIAIRIDGLWRAVIIDQHLFSSIIQRAPILRTPIRTVLGVALSGVCLAAAINVNQSWFVLGQPDTVGQADNVCIDWLRKANPDRQLSVYAPGYYAITAYLQNKVRLFNVGADFRMIPDPPTIFKGVDLTRALPEFGLGWEARTRSTFINNGFVVLDQSPKLLDPIGCLWRNPDPIPYAFSAPTALLNNLSPTVEALRADMVKEITQLERNYDNIGLIVQSDPQDELVVSIQETTYPGWRVFVDGQRTILESVGGQLGVKIAANSGQHFVWFQFWPDLFFVGGIITLVTWLLCILYLLRADRFLPQGWYRWVGALTNRAVHVMFNPDIFTPKDAEAQPIPLLPPATAVSPAEPPLEILTEADESTDQHGQS